MKVKRSEQEILRDLAEVEWDMSPENVSCDGELPVAEVAKRMRALHKKRIKLVKELGREPTFTELNGIPL